MKQILRLWANSSSRTFLLFFTWNWQAARYFLALSFALKDDREKNVVIAVQQHTGSCVCLLLMFDVRWLIYWCLFDYCSWCGQLNGVHTRTHIHTFWSSYSYQRKKKTLLKNVLELVIFHSFCLFEIFIRWIFCVLPRSASLPLLNGNCNDDTETQPIKISSLKAVNNLPMVPKKRSLFRWIFVIQANMFKIYINLFSM